MSKGSKVLADYLYYHEDGPPSISIYCGDCLDILPLLPKVDLVVTDPPYGVNLAYEQYQDTEANWFALMDKFIPLVRSKSTMSIMPSCQIKRLDWIYKNHAPDWLLCWYKGSPGHVGYMGFNDWEPHLVYGKNSTTVHDYFHATPEPQTNGHPCQKPLKWAKWQVWKCSEEGHLVCDPFLGSGTVAVVAKDLKRNFIGIELSDKYCEIAKVRLKNTIVPFL